MKSFMVMLANFMILLTLINQDIPFLNHIQDLSLIVVAFGIYLSEIAMCLIEISREVKRK